MPTSFFLEMQRMPTLTLGQIGPHGFFESSIGVFSVVEKTIIVTPTSFNALIEFFEIATIYAIYKLHV